VNNKPLKRELEYFFAALRFFTRLPVPQWVGHSAEQLNHAARYFPLMGIIVGVIGAAVTYSVAMILPISLAIILGMVATILTTGAFHEDGFADAVDGFGGGYEKSRILDIMKDSRVGSYGVIAMALLLLAKFTALSEISTKHSIVVLCVVLISGHAISRLASTTLLYFLDYVREDALSKAKPLSTQLTRSELCIASISGLLPLLFLFYTGQKLCSLVIALLLATVTTVWAASYFKKHIGGYTGDCLGATQQATEIAFYIGLLCKFS
jgi:adenosylcobinamide-GDP ribazoletransferase